MRRLALIALGAVLVVLSLAPSAQAEERSCGWTLEPTADRENILFPEVTTRYLAGVVPVPPGGSVEISGEFPHARYMSLSTYSSTLQPIQSIADSAIVPDAGSGNPYAPGADRNVAKRSYTVHLRAGRQPADPPANTLYNQSTDGSRTGNGLAYRIYLPDRAAGPFGGVKPPHITFVLPGGTRVPLPMCPDLLKPVGDLGLTQAEAALGTNLPLAPAGLLGRRVPVWKRYTTVVRAYVDDFLDADLPDKLFGGALAKTALPVTKLFPAGLGENFDNKYVYTSLTPEYGRVMAFRGEMPTTPLTYEGAGTMGSGQLRFWSMCTGNQATQVYGCSVDEQTALRNGRHFTVVISTAADRPANATTECGYTWLPWGPLPKPDVIMRNMLPAPDFHHAVQDTNADKADEKAVLGPYYPVGQYYPTPQSFEALGCDRG